MGQHTLSGTQQPTRGHRAIVVRISYHLEIAVPFSIPLNETAIKEKEFGSKKSLKILFSFHLPSCLSQPEGTSTTTTPSIFFSFSFRYYD